MIDFQHPKWLERAELLVGTHTLTRLQNAHVLIVGLGGIGGAAAEMIARAGIGRITIVDGDTVERSNRNRQLVALESSNDHYKAEVYGNRIRDINPHVQLTVLTRYLIAEAIDEVLAVGYDYVIDCIDTLSPKVHLLRQCLERNLPVVSAMGAGGKLDPTQVKIADISESYNCKLARYVRKKLHRLGISEGITVVFSPEEIDRSRVFEIPEGRNKKSVIGTISYLPNIFGCFCASVAIRGIMGTTTST